LLKEDEFFRNNIWPHISVWDTQLAEYLITSQQSKMSSLDELAEKYESEGCTLKDDRIKDFWDAGVETEDIPADILGPYCENDVLNTQKIFLAQMKKVGELRMFALVRTQMEALLAVTEMEFNGMQFNKEGAKKEADKLGIKLATIEAKLIARMQPSFKHRCPMPASNKDISAFLFGGEYEYKEQEEQLDAEGNVIVYKTGLKKGQPKTKSITKTEKVLGNFIASPLWGTKKAGVYKVDESVLKELLNSMGASVLHPTAEFLMGLLEYRQLMKDVNTYYIGYSKLVWPDGCIHGKLNQCLTNTGRLSSSSPNLQNISGD
jgi:DNA polymerase I-like protein with 3'-5' exonuclease and polymerase domains